MKHLIILFLFSISVSSFGQKISTNNFFTIMKGNWIAEYYDKDWKSIRDIVNQPNPDTVIINSNGLIKTKGKYGGENYEHEEKWINYNDKVNKIYYRYYDMINNKWSNIIERYKVLSISKDEMKVEFTGYSEAEPNRPIKTRIIFKRIK